MYLQALWKPFLVCCAVLAMGCQSYEASAQQYLSAHAETGQAQSLRAVKMTPRARYLTDNAQESLGLRLASLQVQCQVPEKKRSLRRFTKEGENLSYSIGNTSNGYLVGARQLTQPSLRYRALPVQYERDLGYGTSELIELVEDTAKAMHKRYPGSVLFLGNFGAREGGDIPYSVSHKSGRDADLAYFFKRTSSDVAQIPQNLIRFGASLNSKNVAGYRFDTEKNAALIEILITHPKIDVQFIFVAKHLRRAIRQAMVLSGVSEQTLARFDVIVQEQAAHADHMHIRVYCAKHEICAGCVDRSLIHEWHPDPLVVREECIQRYEKILTRKSSEPQNIAAALERLHLMGVIESSRSAVLKLLAHEDTDVRLSAAQAAAQLSLAASPLSERLALEQDNEVKCALFESLASLKDEASMQHLVEALNTQEIECGAQSSYELILKTLALSESTELAKKIIERRAQVQARLWPYFDKALQSITNQVAVNGDWLQWLLDEGSKSRKQWLVDGFRAAGFRVKSLGNVDIPVLLDALLGPEHVSLNARRVLMQLSGKRPACLEWSAADTLWYFTRYFKGCQKKYKIDLSDRNERGLKVK